MLMQFLQWNAWYETFQTYLLTAELSLLFVSYKVLAEYIITKLSADSILDDNRKILIVCGKCHVVHDVAVLLS